MNKQELPLPEVARRTAHLINGMMTFWKTAQGWAPIEAAALLSKSMLEWQSSLAGSLSKWTGEMNDGELILAWVNVGALVEGQLKLFLSVHYKDYLGNIEAAFKDKNGAVVDPDGVTLDKLRVFFKKNIWSSTDTWDAWILLVQQRRNAVHAFKAKDIGTPDELHATLRTLRTFVLEMNRRLPYPDEVYEPRER